MIVTPRDHASAVSMTELERRWAAVRAYLRDHHADALVATGTHDYFGGYYRWLTDRPAYWGYEATVIFHVDAPMTVIDHGELEGEKSVEGNAEYPGVGRARTTAAWESVHFTHGLQAALLLDELRRKGCRRIAIVGLAAMSHSMASALIENEFELLDATDWLDGVKAVKSDEELALVRQVAWLQDRVFALAIQQIRPGMIEQDVKAIVQYEAAKLGSSQGVVITGSAAPGQSAFMRFPYYQERRIRAGDYMSLLIEVSGRSGYYCEMGRIICFGKAPQEITDAIAQSKELQAATLKNIRPGVEAREVAERHDDNLRAAGLKVERRLFSHGQGYDLIERPLIRSDETMTIAKGMNITCHPAVASTDIFGFVCDNHIVTDDGTTPIHTTEQTVFEL